MNKYKKLLEKIHKDVLILTVLFDIGIILILIGLTRNFFFSLGFGVLSFFFVYLICSLFLVLLHKDELLEQKLKGEMEWEK